MSLYFCEIQGYWVAYTAKNEKNLECPLIYGVFGLEINVLKMLV